MKTLLYTVSDFSQNAEDCINLLFNGIEKDQNIDFCVVSNRPSPPGFKYKTITVDTPSNYIGYLKYCADIPDADQYLYLDSDILFFGSIDNVFSKDKDLSLVVEDFPLTNEWFSYHISNKESIPSNVFGLNAGTFAFKDKKILSQITEKINTHFDETNSARINAMLEQSLFNEFMSEKYNYDWSLTKDLTGIAKLHIPDNCIYDSKVQIYHFCGWTGNMTSKYARMVNFLKIAQNH